MSKVSVIKRPWLALSVLVAVAVIMVMAAPSMTARGADHLDAPLVSQDGRIDINDVFVFHPVGESGEQDLGQTVLVMTVNPAAGLISGTEFRKRATYDLLIDTDGDAISEIRVRTRFGKPDDGEQRVRTTWMQRGRRATANGETEEIFGRGGMTVFAGLRDDPFFLDFDNFNNGATFCGAGLPVSNFFQGFDVSAIVIQVPTSWLGDGQVGVWGRTGTGASGRVQADRMGRPAINTVFIPNNPFEPAGTEPSQKDDFNAGLPRNDQRDFRAEIVDSLTLLFSLNDGSDDPSDDAAKIQGLADILLPDILTVDLSQETGFLNGRGLEDDVMDAELGLITEGLITTDCVDNDSTFLDEFPYLGVPNADVDDDDDDDEDDESYD